MSLDVNTPQGRETVADCRRAADSWEREYPEFELAFFPEDSASAVDAAIVRRESRVICGLVEFKCRYSLTLDRFERVFGGEWLITMAKLVKAAVVASHLSVPVYGFLFLVEDETLLTRRLIGPDGNFVVDLSCRVSSTQRTCNDRTTVDRANAYVTMNTAKRVRVCSDEQSDSDS